MYRIFTLLLLATLISPAVFSQTPVLIKDINPVTTDNFSGSLPGKGIIINGKMYFAADDYQGREPWKTDGTGAGTVILKDVFSFAAGDDANPHDFVNVGSVVYFFVGDSAHSELWKISTGDTVKRVVSNVFIYPHDPVVVGSTIVFSGTIEGTNEGQELLRFDTAVGSIQSFDINPGTAGSDPRYLLAKADTIFFSADDGSAGRELWIYDLKNVSPVTLIGDLNTGSGDSNPSDFVIYHDTLFFSATTDPDGTELYYSDGNASGSGTTFFASINDINDPADSSSPSNKTVFNNKLIFSANNGTNGQELWEYDGLGNIGMLKDIYPGPVSSSPGLTGFKAAGSYLYFAADSATVGVELWRTDGNFGGTTRLVNNIRTGAASSNPQSMNNLSDTLIFVADDGNGAEMWRSNGINTTMIQNIQPLGSNAPIIVGKYNNKIYFGADNGTVGNELWATNGLSAGTSIIKDINRGNFALSSNIPWLENFNSAVYFPATKDALNQAGLHKTDGTTVGTTEIVPPGGATNFLVNSTPGKVAGSLLYFSAFTSAQGNELWKTTGTLAGTAIVKDIATTTASSTPASITSFGTKVLFTADDGTNGTELWVSDGTSGGTFMLVNIATGATSSNPLNITVVGTKAFFTADNAANGRELWITDGTTVGTTLVKNIMAGAASSNPSGLTAAGSLLYFYAEDGVNGGEPWKSDGTLAGTTLLSNINPSTSITSYFSDFCTLGAYTYFGADNGTGAKLYRTDGTTTSLFNSIPYPFKLINIGTKIVFFCAPVGSPYNFELYNTDGTTVNKVYDFAPYGLSYVILDNFPVHQNKAYYWLDDNVHGQELWGSDGTTAGTISYDIAPGVSSSYPRHARSFSTALLFTANDGTPKGDELWRLDFGTLPVSGLEFNVQKKEGTKALLNWKTFSEFNNTGFGIERSEDGRTFANIGFVTARGISNSGAIYEFTDASPVTGRNYYRLKQTDADGKFTYSPVRWVDFSKDAYVKAYPNPTMDVLNINTGYNFKSAVLNIRNATGQLVKQLSVNGSGTISIPVRALPAGVYTVEINEGSISVKLAFMKQ